MDRNSRSCLFTPRTRAVLDIVRPRSYKVGGRLSILALRVWLPSHAGVPFCASPPVTESAPAVTNLLPAPARLRTAAGASARGAIAAKCTHARGPSGVFERQILQRARELRLPGCCRGRAGTSDRNSDTDVARKDRALKVKGEEGVQPVGGVCACRRRPGPDRIRVARRTCFVGRGRRVDVDRHIGERHLHEDSDQARGRGEPGGVGRGFE